MKTIQITFFAIFALCPFANFACGPCFPETYFDNGKFNDELKTFEYSYSWAQEIEYIVLEKYKDLSQWSLYPNSKISTKEGQILDYKEKRSLKNRLDRSTLEFELYKAGKREMTNNNDPAKIPKSWIKLLKLPQRQRRYRTIWTCYMIGNLYYLAGEYNVAKKFYRAVRVSYQKGFKDTLGLAHATYKREFLSALAPEDKLNAALKALAYYAHSKDYKRHRFIIFELYDYIKNLQRSEKSIKKLFKNPSLRELLISFNLGMNFTELGNFVYKGNGINREIKTELIDKGNSSAAARFAWLEYRNGDMERAKQLLTYAKKDDLLTLWLSAKLALYDGQDAKAAEYLRRWLRICNKNRNKLQASRLAPGFNDAKKAEKDVYGIMGNAIIHTQDFREALHCFIRAEDWPSAAIVAEKLMSQKELIDYVDINAPKYNSNVTKTFYYEEESALPKSEHKELIQNKLRHLLARRLVRKYNFKKAMEYIPPNLLPKLKQLEYYLGQTNNRSLSNNNRALASYNAARIMRWYGMSLCGTELWPDYQYCDGDFENIFFFPEWAKERKMKEIAKIAEKHTPEKRRFHYRFKACDIMRKSLEFAENDDLKLLANLAIGYWLYKKHPKEADPYYKAAVSFRPAIIAVDFDKRRWFTPKDKLPLKLYNQIFGSEPVLKVEDLAKIGILNYENKNINN